MPDTREDPWIEWALCCGQAKQNAEGFMSLDYVFLTLAVQRLPCQGPLTIVVSVRGTPYRRFTYRLDLIEPSGTRYRNPGGLRHAAVGRFGASLVTYDATPFATETAGDYRFEMYLDDRPTPAYVLSLPVVHDPTAGLRVSDQLQ